MKLFSKRTVPGEGTKMSILTKARENPKKSLNVISTSLLIILPFCICLLGTFLLTLNFIRSEAYRYSDNTYKGIEEVLRGVEVTLSDGNVELQNPKITLSDGTVEEIIPCIVKGEGIDDKVLRKYLDSYGGTYNINYENGQTKLTCSIKDGYFNAVVTTWISEDYGILKMARNYNSLGAYMENLIRQVGLAVIGIALGIFLGVEVLIFGGLAVYGKFYNYQNERKKKKEEASSSSQTANPTLYMGTATAE